MGTCKRCGKINSVGCYFEIKDSQELKELKMLNPDTVWLCAYSCYPKDFLKQNYPNWNKGTKI